MRHAAVIVLVFSTCLPAQARTEVLERPSDALIASWVKSALGDDSRIGTNDLDVRSRAGIVTLSGQVADFAAKQYADLETKKIAGVVGVVNRIEVRPDSEILADVRRRLASSVEARALQLHVAVVDGAVTLTGTTYSASQDKEAELLAGEVRGVRTVDNQIVVDFKLARSDREIRNDIVSAIGRDVYLSGLPIRVRVRNGVAKLSGTVGSPLEKERAVQDSLLVVNVKDVFDRIKIDPLVTTATRRAYSIPSNDELKQFVCAELEADSRVNASLIRIEASLGGITLHGTVPTWYQRQVAELDALDVVGVARVDNQLEVEVVPRDDPSIQDDVLAALKSDYLLADLDISVRVEGGKVSLSGRVNSYFEKRHAIETMTGVVGLRSVVNRLDVSPAAPLDNRLRERIEERLLSNWSTRRVADRIYVEVDGDHVVLTGDVDTWTEYREAPRLTLRTRGVGEVTNKLVVNKRPA